MRRLDRFKVSEISGVGKPAQVPALAVLIKSDDSGASPEVAEAIAKLAKGTSMFVTALGLVTDYLASIVDRIEKSEDSMSSADKDLIRKYLDGHSDVMADVAKNLGGDYVQLTTALAKAMGGDRTQLEKLEQQESDMSTEAAEKTLQKLRDDAERLEAEIAKKGKKVPNVAESEEDDDETVGKARSAFLAKVAGYSHLSKSKAMEQAAIDHPELYRAFNAAPQSRNNSDDLRKALEPSDDLQKARGDFTTKVNEIKKRDGITSTKAMEKAAIEHPALYEAYRTA